jgi:hypothetical protein
MKLQCKVGMLSIYRKINSNCFANLANLYLVDDPSKIRYISLTLSIIIREIPPHKN